MKQVKFEWSGPHKKTLEKYNKIKNDLVLKIDRTPFYKFTRTIKLAISFGYKLVLVKGNIHLIS